MQIFANVWDIPKHTRNDHKVKDILRLPESIISDTGYHSGGTLYLNDTLRGLESRISSSGFIILTDYLREKFAGMEDFELFHDANHPRRSGIFILRMKNEKLTLSLNYSENKYTIGDPERADFTFGEISEADTLRFTLNSKNDSHDQRKYCWFDYLFCGYHLVHEVVFDSPSNIRISKSIPREAAREVTLLKDIY